MTFWFNIYPFDSTSESLVQVFYLDDGTLLGGEADVIHNYQSIGLEAGTIGL